MITIITEAFAGYNYCDDFYKLSTKYIFINRN